jgi:hypothetical protein
LLVYKILLLRIRGDGHGRGYDADHVINTISKGQGVQDMWKKPRQKDVKKQSLKCKSASPTIERSPVVTSYLIIRGFISKTIITMSI